MTAPLIQKKLGNKSSDTIDHTTTFDATPAQNNLLICGIHFRNTVDEALITLAGWTTIRSRTNGAVGKMWYKIAGASEPTAVTVDSDIEVAASAMFLAEYSGIDTTNPLDQHGGADSGSAPDVNSLLSATISTQASDSLIIAMIGTRLAHGGGFGWTDSFIHQDDIDSTGGSISGIGWAHRSVTSSGNYSTTGSWTNSQLQGKF